VVHNKGEPMSQVNIPDEMIREVLKHHDIVDVVGKFVHLTKKGRNYSGLCPFHSEKTPSFSVSPEKQIYHCFGCGAGGDAIKFMMEMDGSDDHDG
jgi:DNA primase